ncbi:hypothetical protein B0H34DRAFT_378550 [Crassisporium funariophilum]|nr:hypothetical protein B0H34DRAFT_378550 [Crassisporium funariophilum]
MTLPPQNLLAWQISLTLLHTAPIGFTLVRLAHHWRLGRLWWDDYVVCIPLLADCVYILQIWLKYRNGLEASRGPEFQNVFYSVYIALSLFFTVIWTSRISLALSIARIFPPNHRARKFAFLLVTTFTLTYIIFFLTATLTCRASHSVWFTLNLSNCTRLPSGRLIGSMPSINPVYLAVDFAADAVLIITPSIMLWKVKLPVKERRLVLVLFSSSILTLLSAIPYALIWFFGVRLPPDSQLVLYTMIPLFETAFSLLVCNLTIVTMLFYRTLNRPSSPSSPSAHAPQQIRTEDAPTPSTSTQTPSQTYESARPPASTRSYTNMTFTSIYDEESVRLPLPELSLYPSTSDAGVKGEVEGEGGGYEGGESGVPPWSFEEKSFEEKEKEGS